jgi:glycosyltransferase involved in cell wall biosynthesis
VTPGRLEDILLLAYLALGPLAWAFYGMIIIAGHRRMLLMKPTPIVGPPPPVTILIPAKDEGQRIRDCLLSALNQDYPNFDVIAVDDRSEDETGAVMDELAVANARFKAIHITEPPATGWTGKNNALATGVRDATGEWMLFVDSDVILQPAALSVAMGVVLRKDFDLLSLLPKLESHSIWESLLVPLAGAAASSMYLIALTNASGSNVAFANGQFLFIKRTAYEAFGGHTTVRDRYCEDIEIARQLKARSLRPRISWGNDYAAVRMYSSLPAIFRGWSRIFYAGENGSPWRPLAAVLFLFLCGFSSYFALVWGLWRAGHAIGAPAKSTAGAWVCGSALHLVLMTYFLARIYHWSGNPRRNALLFPVAGPMLVMILLRGIKMCITRKVEWRGTAYSHVMASDLSAHAAEVPSGSAAGAKIGSP